VTRALVLTGGPDHAHDFPSSGAALAAVVGLAGFDVTVVDDPEAAATRLTEGAFAVLVVNALRWRMLDERYRPWREQWGYSPSAAVRDTLSGFVACGGGLVGSHTASICFDDWPGWGELLGGAWDWDRSSHPPLGPAEVRVVATHPVVAGLPRSFTVVDEVYGDQRLQPGIEVLAVSRRTPDDAEQPVVWAHAFGTGRVVYEGFGHDASSLQQPELARLVQQAVRWAAPEEC
jgi:type 1 glutamine amidotransferase